MPQLPRTAELAAPPHSRPGHRAALPTALGRPARVARRRSLLFAAGVVAGVLGAAVPASAAVHVVRPGDTLSGIAQRHGTSTATLARANGLTSADLVVIGRSLTIPGGTAATTTGTHRVAPGDTLSTIAARYGVPTATLASANGIADRNMVVIGRTLTLPGGGGASSSQAGSAGAHQVARGETLSHIALRYGVSTSALASANAISDPNRVVVGRTLAVPAGTGGPAVTTGTTTSSARHTVRLGEALSTIAARYGVTSTALAQANGIRNHDFVTAGSTLTVPGGGGAAGGPAPTGLPSRLHAEPSRLALMPLFRQWAANYGVPADLLMAMTWLESGWQSSAVSSTGAVGIGQLMPATVEWMEDVIIREPLDVHDPSDNIRMSARYLRWLLDRTGSTRTSLAGYYQGLRSVLEIGLYDDTEVYVDGVLALRPRFG